MVHTERRLAPRPLVENGARRAMLITEVNDEPVARSPLASFLAEVGFTPGSHGYQKRAADRGARAAGSDA